MSNEEMQEPAGINEEISVSDDEPPAPVWYVSYNDAGELTGYYFQAVNPAHTAAHIVLDGPLAEPWVMYRANAARDGVEIAPPRVPSIEEMTDRFRYTVQERIDQVARAFGYDNILTAVSYADEPAVPKYQTEGRALRAWRSLVWKHCEDQLALVAGGSIPVPNESEVLASLPAAPVIDEPEEPAA